MYQQIPATPVGPSQCVRRISDGALIPFATGNKDYTGYLAWVKAGNTPLPVDGEETVLVRARNEDGTYVADDPSTPENEAYTEVPLSDA